MEENDSAQSETQIPVLKTTDNNVSDNEDELDLGDVSSSNSDGRNELFQKGLQFEQSGKKNCALKCYLSCLTGLQTDSHFVLLPQCLRNIADIYFKKEEYEKAILFIQAEKLYYENALIDTTQIENTLEKLRRHDPSKHDSSEPIDEYSVRADEYEHLAKLCMDQNQPHLALEYAGKATKIRQQVFGNNHQVTKDSLDYFATLYAEVGRKQYSDSINQLSADDNKNNFVNASPTSILRQRKQGSIDSLEEKEKKSVHFGEPLETRRVIYDDNLPRSLTVLFLLFGCMVMVILGTWLFCLLQNDHVCRSFTSELQYMYTRFRYLLYNYTGSKKFKN